jgi:large subunit ribosomal protein L11
MMKEVIELLVEGGKAKPSQTIISKLENYKIKAEDVFKEINEKTKEYQGEKVKVKILINKGYEIKISAPSVASLIKKELGIEVAKITPEEKAAGKTSVGNLSFEQIVKIAKIKFDDLLVKDLKTAVKVVLGTANSLTGVLVENKRPKEIIKEIDEGKWDEFFK